MKRQRVFLSGPMTGKYRFNFPAFDAARDWLERKGHTAVSPADLDRSNSFDAMILPDSFNWHSTPPGFDMRAARHRDIAALETCDAILLLSGWQDSKGSRAEKAYADWCGIPEFKL